MVNSEQLKKLHIGAEWVDALNETFGRFNISTKRQQAAFIANANKLPSSGNVDTNADTSRHWKKT